MRLPGKKIDVLRVQGKISRHEIDLRFAREESMFYAVVLGETLKHKDARELESLVKNAIHANETIVFDDVILLDLEMHARDGRLVAGGFSQSDEADPDRINGFTFRFEACALSREIQKIQSEHRSSREYRLVQELDVKPDGTIAARREPERVYWLPTRPPVPFTAARWKVLVDVERRMRDLAARLQAALGPDADAAKTLDTAGAGMLLLTAPAPGAR